ncbi:MAG: hypothetical protein OEV30_12865 [Ignavibacteria bacterium]|nr:hypothetical protein [Ignavibacteria bacterium]
MFYRVSRASNFEFVIYNNGMLYGELRVENNQYLPMLAHWPRGSYHLSSDVYRGFMFLAQKNGQRLVSDAGFMRITPREHGPFDCMVPGWIGDPKAGCTVSDLLGQFRGRN